MRDYIQHVRVSFVWPLAVMLKNEPTVSGLGLFRQKTYLRHH